tara:strand:+ start:1304 stop:1537 length:234 start_codon:yes stop_codon:yes gene_type:complete
MLNKHLKKVKKENKIILNNLVKNELNKIFKTDYYGSKEQIKNEKIIMNNCIVLDNNLEMKYNESIEEYYLKIYDFTK